MGCGNSSQEKDSNAVVTTKKHKVSIHVSIGNNVHLEEKKPQLIIVFGGPGSRKGKLLDDISHVYGIQLLSIEMILLEELGKKLPQEDTDDLRKTAQIAQLVKNQPELMRLHWILNQVGNAIDKLPKNRCYMVDFMPNLKFLMSAFSGVTECDNEFKVFENRYPISFAIDFSVKSVKKQLEPQCAVPVTEASKAKDNKQTAAQGKQSDEADTGRLARRATLYNNSAKIFVDFFQKSERFVTVDVTSRAEEEIWEKMCELFSKLNVIHLRNTSTVMFFMFEKRDLEHYQVENLEAERVNVIDMAVDINAPPERIIPAVCKFVDDAYPTKKRFIIDLDQSTLTKDCMKKWTLLKRAYKSLLDPKKVLQFRDIEECNVKDYIPLVLVTKTMMPSVKVLCSSENEVCLFPRDTPHNLCKYVAGLYRAYRELIMQQD
ncbi:hypothetical protein FSP39_002967 [Pinctada imbricata]|uniref:Uncharacterized protein n=1 Tax=Pinctada imbricata TaxID=66713 RepID=A0AA89C4Z2_PINIB|nr:hypothetical protein FSP39_002967 [Pinctada imbricata]